MIALTAGDATQQQSNSSMVPLDSPRWSQLSTAYGTAEHIPDLIRAVAAEADRAGDNSADSAWQKVYEFLIHQDTTYSATYAALPHLVAIANEGALAQRVETLLFAGVICVKSVLPSDLADDLLADFQPALDKIRPWSLQTVRDATLDKYTPLPCLLQSFGGLRYPRSWLVFYLDFFTFHDEVWEVELECETCNQRYPRVDDFHAPKSLFAVHMTVSGPISLPWYGSDMPIEGNQIQLPVNREAHSQRLAQGAHILNQSDDPTWAPSETSNVLAALAAERGNLDLATRILDFQSTILCPRCRSEIELSAHIF